MSRRRAHSCTNQQGTTFPVREHAFNSGAASRQFDLRWKHGQAYVNGAVTYQTICPQCKETVFFYRNEYGSRVFFDSLGKPWPQHGCAHGLKRLHSVSIAHAQPVTKANYSEPMDVETAMKEVFIDIESLNSAVRQYSRNLRKTGNGSKIFKKKKQK